MLRKVMYWVLGLWAVGVLVFMVQLGTEKVSTTTPAAPDSRALAVAACDRAQEAVRAQLKAPSTAEFPSCLWSDAYQLRSNDQVTYFVTGYVDAQNSFGAKLRSRFVVQLMKATTGTNPSDWSIIKTAVAP